MKSLLLKASMFSVLSVVFVPNLSFATDTEEIQTETQTDQELQLDGEWAQWGRYAHRSRVTCFVRAPRGRTFSGASHSVGQAQRIAMNRCLSWSRNCRHTGCRRGW